MKNNFSLISIPKSEIFSKQKLSVAYRINKSLSDYLLKNDIADRKLHSNVTPCGKWKLCPQLNTTRLTANDKLNKTEKIKGTANCKEREVIYAAQSSKHKALYIGHIGEQLSERFSKQRYDIKNWPDNSELAEHFYKSHKINYNLNVTILQDNIKTATAGSYHGEKWICRLKTLTPQGLNIKIYDYAKEMYNLY